VTNYRKNSMFPKTLSACIEPVTRPILKTQGLAGNRILSEWSQIVGEKLAAHSIPQKLSFPAGKKTDGNLTIATENGFAPEVQHMQAVILERLATYFGYKAVSRITISHSYVSDVPKLKPKLKGTLKASSIELATSVEDEELRAALTDIAKTLVDS
jgi:hypothetical protein